MISTEFEIAGLVRVVTPYFFVFFLLPIIILKLRPYVAKHAVNYLNPSSSEDIYRYQLRSKGLIFILAIYSRLSGIEIDNRKPPSWERIVWFICAATSTIFLSYAGFILIFVSLTFLIDRYFLEIFDSFAIFIRYFNETIVHVQIFFLILSVFISLIYLMIRDCRQSAWLSCADMMKEFKLRIKISFPFLSRMPYSHVIFFIIFLLYYFIAAFMIHELFSRTISDEQFLNYWMYFSFFHIFYQALMLWVFPNLIAKAIFMTGWRVSNLGRGGNG